MRTVMWLVVFASSAVNNPYRRFSETELWISRDTFPPCKYLSGHAHKFTNWYVEAGPGVTRAACSLSDPQKWVLHLMQLCQKHVGPSSMFTHLFDWVEIIRLPSLPLRLWLTWCICCLSFSFKTVKDGIVRWNIQAGLQRKLHKEFCLLGYNSMLTLDSCSDYSSTLQMEALCSYETSVDSERTTRLYIPEERTPHSHRCENLKSYMSLARPPLFGLLNQPWMVDDDECGAVGGMRIGGGNRST
jgi:hypothetical protein